MKGITIINQYCVLLCSDAPVPSEPQWYDNDETKPRGFYFRNRTETKLHGPYETERKCCAEWKIYRVLA